MVYNYGYIIISKCIGWVKLSIISIKYDNIIQCTTSKLVNIFNCTNTYTMVFLSLLGPSINMVNAANAKPEPNPSLSNEMKIIK